MQRIITILDGMLEILGDMRLLLIKLKEDHDDILNKLDLIYTQTIKEEKIEDRK